MKINWEHWTIGQRTIFVAGCLATVSLFLPWVDVGIATSSGFGQAGFIFLALFIYPVLKVLKNQEISIKWGMVCSILAVVLSIAFAISKTGELFGKTINVSGSGLYLFIACSIALLIGVRKETKRT